MSIKDVCQPRTIAMYTNFQSVLGDEDLEYVTRDFLWSCSCPIYLLGDVEDACVRV